MWVVPFSSSGCAHVVHICVFNSSRHVCRSSFTSRFIADHSHVEKRTKCDSSERTMVLEGSKENGPERRAERG